MIFQVEKNTAARSHQVTNYAGPFRSEELHPHFVSQSGVAHGRHNLVGCGRGRNVKGDDQMLSRIIHLIEFK